MHRIQTPASLIPMQKSVRKADNLVIKNGIREKVEEGYETFICAIINK